MVPRRLLWTAAIGLLAIAQQPGEYRLKINVELVQIDAVVNGADGKPVRDLKPEDFSAMIDGKALPVKHATYIEVPVSGTTPTHAPKAASESAYPQAPLKPEEIRRTIVFFVDDLSLSSERLPAARKGLRQAVEALAPGDLAAVVKASAGPGALRDYTNDRSRLLAAADQIRWNPKGRGEPEAYQRFGRDPILEAIEDSGNSMGQEVERLRDEVYAVNTLQSLDRVVRGMESLPGRKIVMLLADYLPLSSRLISEGPGLGKAAFALRDFGGLIPGTAMAVIEHAARAGVVINAIDTRGLSPLTMTAADRVTSVPAAGRRRAEYLSGQESPSYIAEQTGGVMITDSNDIGASLTEIASHMGGYYLLGVEPPPGTFERNKDGSARFRSIGVSVNRPGLRVRTRSGFLGIADSEFDPGRNAGQQFAAALDSPFRQVGVKTSVRCAFLSVEKSRSVILTRVGIAAGDLSLEGPPHNRSAIIHLVVRAYGVDGAELEGGIDQRLRINLDQEGTRVALANGLVYSTNVSVSKPGPYQIRAAVLDEASGRIGTGLEFLVIPKTGGRRMVLSDLTFPSYFGTENRVTPAWERLEVVPGQPVRCAFQVFNAGGRELRQRARLFRDGRLVYEEPSSPLARDRGKGSQALANAQLRLPPDLEPGDYYLQVEVSDGSGKALRWGKLTVMRGKPGTPGTACMFTAIFLG